MPDTGDESNDDGLGPVVETSIEQLTEGDTLDDSGVEDPLDRGYSPPDSDRGSRAFGVTAEEQHRAEPLEERIRQEDPDPTTAYGAPSDDRGLDTDMLGGDDPDAIPTREDWLGDGEVGGARAGRLVADDEGTHEDDEPELWARDVGIDGAAASAEEAAVHVVDPDTVTDEE